MLTLEALRLVQDDFRLGADLKVAPGARVAVIGPSGAGKSTLLAAIAGFFAPESGRILWKGSDLTPLPPAARPVSVIFQDNNLFPHLTAFRNVALGVTPLARLTGEESERVEAALRRVGLADLGARKPGALSGGQQSRVALARMLVRRQPLVLLDEPFAALGPALKAEMIDLVGELAADTGASVMMVTHDPADARRLGGQTMLVAEGLVHPPQDSAALLDDPPAALSAYLGGHG